MERFQSCTLNGLLWQDLVAKTPFGGEEFEEKGNGMDQSEAECIVVETVGKCCIVFIVLRKYD